MNRSSILYSLTQSITRREFSLQTGLGLAGLVMGGKSGLGQDAPDSALALARNSDRRKALRDAVGLLGTLHFGGRDLYLKANFNSPNPFPATTHPETLSTVVEMLRECHCGRLTLVERSGMGDTRTIWDTLGISRLARDLDVQLRALEDLPADQWRKEELPGSSWKTGVEVPGFLDSDTWVIQICNLKAHRFGAVFSASLKNSVGLVAKFGHVNSGYNYMNELHASPQQGAMIADLNRIYAPKLVIMDAMRVFTSGGPDTGGQASPEVVLASSDRLAIDAAGVALLRLHASGPPQPLAWKTVYEQDQLKRAAELKLGATGAGEIRFLTANSGGGRLASQLDGILREVPKSKT